MELGAPSTPPSAPSTSTSTTTTNNTELTELLEKAKSIVISKLIDASVQAVRKVVTQQLEVGVDLNSDEMEVAYTDRSVLNYASKK